MVGRANGLRETTREEVYDLMSWYETMQIIIGFLIFLATCAMVKVTYYTWKASIKQVEATNKQINASVRPYIHFLIRPLSHYNDHRIPYSKKGWLPGAGIYVENIGPGPAIDYKISCEIIARDGSTRSCNKSFTGSRILPGQRYAYPSTDWDEPRIQIEDEKITIETECNDRIGNHHKQEPVEIELEESFFKGYSGGRYSISGEPYNPPGR